MTSLARVQSLTAERTDGWLREIRARAPECEARRALTRKPVATGTIGEAACLYLRAVVEAVQPVVCAEVGTFIGTSALVLASTGARVHTCDKDNDAFGGTDTITCYGKTTSTDMLAGLVSGGVTVDLFFFDGRIQAEDVPLILALSHARTAYAFDDYEGREKGVANVERLRPMLPRHRLVPPSDAPVGHTTIALLVRP